MSAKHATNPATTPAIVTPAQSEDTQASHSNNETLATTLAQYLTYKKLKPNTSRSYSDALKFHLKAFADKPVSSLTSQNVLQLYNQLLETLKPTTANLQIRVLRALHRFWYASQGKTSPDIFKAISILGTRQKSTVRTRHLSDDQLKQLGQQWHKLSLQEQAFMQLALYTGFRLSELKSLTPASYDPVARALHLSHTKNGKPHTLPVAQSLHTLLAELCQAAPAYLLSRHIHNYASIISRKIGIPFSCHDLRRTFATHATKLGISAYIVKALLNHTNTNDVTERHYIHLHIDDLKMPIETISNHFSNLIHNK
ncbi:hypothetical protein BS642_13690 [Chromobacterium violaceum]|nr:hypothetical protein BS642_13690 [Chromobacterium violaceum]